VADNAQMVMAGLWAKWKSPTSGEEVLSCTILTCGPNQAMGELHDRMPVILRERLAVGWVKKRRASKRLATPLRNLWKNFRACLNAAPTAVAGYF
jgi:putative SOS response-associated peptidase YedK